MIKAIFFDCFGLFYPDSVNTLRDDPIVTEDLALDIDKLDDKASLGFITIDQFINQVSSALKWSHEQTKDYFLIGKDRNEALISLVQKMRQNYRVGLLSNVGKDMMDGFFTHDELASMFDVTVLSADVHLAKPDPKIFLLACERLDTSPSETLLIDDTPEYITGAKNIGIQTIHYKDIYSLKRELKLLNIHLE